PSLKFAVLSQGNIPGSVGVQLQAGRAAGLPLVVSLAPDHSGVVLPRKLLFPGTPFFLCSAEINSACAEVLPAAKRSYGASAPPHLRWGPGDNAAHPRAISRVA